MTKAIISVWVIIMLLIAGVAQRDTYTQEAIITEIDTRNDTVICVDNCTGNEWAFYGVNDWQTDDTITLTMNNNHTSIIYDDVIVGITKR